MKKVKAHNPGVIVDIQSIEGGKVHAIVSLDMGVSPVVLGALWDFGVRHIATNNLNIHSHFPNAFGLEITPDCSL